MNNHNISNEGRKVSFREMEILLILFLSAIFLSGIFAPYNLMFYSRDLLTSFQSFDAILLVLAFFIGLFISILLRKRARIILPIAFILQIIGNALLGNIISINPDELTSIYSTEFTLFGSPQSLAAVTFPIILLVISGLLVLSSGFEILSFSSHYNKKDPVQKTILLSISIALASAITFVIRMINFSESFYVIAIVPISAIIGIFSYLFIEGKLRFKNYDNQTTLNDDKNPPNDNQTARNGNNLSVDGLSSIKKPKRGVGKTILKGLIFIIIYFFIFGMISFSNISLLPTSFLFIRIQAYILTIFITSILTFVVALIGSIKRIRKSKITKFLFGNFAILMIPVGILGYFGFDNAFNPGQTSNMYLQIITSGIIFGFSLLSISILISKKTDVPGLSMYFFGLFIMVSGYTMMIPLSIATVWGQWNIYGTISILSIFIMVIFFVISWKVPDKFSIKNLKILNENKKEDKMEDTGGIVDEK